MSDGAAAFPVLRWVGLLWVVVWLPAYMRVWGWANLLHLCDVAVILACAGLWWGSSLLISSQAVGMLIPGIAWGLDVGWRLFTGRFLLGGTDLYVGCPRSHLGPLVIHLSSRTTAGASLGYAKSRIRPSRVCLTVGHCRHTHPCRAFLASGPQRQLRVSGSLLPSPMGTSTALSCRHNCRHRRVSLLAGPSFPELALPSSEYGEMSNRNKYARMTRP